MSNALSRRFHGQAGLLTEAVLRLEAAMLQNGVNGYCLSFISFINLRGGSSTGLANETGSRPTAPKHLPNSAVFLTTCKVLAAAMPQTT